MPYNLTVSPDFKPDLISGWYIFNTWLQKQLNEAIHVELYQSFKEQADAINEEKVDIIYANPSDISRLVREEGFIPIAKPKEKPDEAIIAAKADGIASINDLPATPTIAQTDAPEVNTIGMIMLEPCDIEPGNVTLIHCRNYIGIAKQILNDKADAGFFLAQAFNELSSLVKKQLKPLISSKIHMIHHALLISPRLADKEAELKQLLLNMNNDEKSQQILKDLEITQWEPMEMEDAEFMVDLIDTLVT